MSRREKLRAKLDHACAQLERRAQARADSERAEYERKVAARERRTGSRQGRHIKAPREEPEATQQINLTDGLCHIVVVGIARPHLDLADTARVEVANLPPVSALARQAEEIADRKAHHDAAATILMVHNVSSRVGIWLITSTDDCRHTSRSRALVAPGHASRTLRMAASPPSDIVAKQTPHPPYPSITEFHRRVCIIVCIHGDRRLLPTVEREINECIGTTRPARPSPWHS